MMIVLYGLYMFVMGSILSSFYTLVGMRVPRGRRISGRSFCDHCEMDIPWYGLIPIAGWFLVRGKCIHCEKKVSLKYPLLEFLGGLLFFLGYLYLHDNVIEYVITMVFVSLMLIVTVSDIEYQLVPDKILLVFFPLLLGLRLAFPLTTWYMVLLGGAVGFLFMYLIALYGKKRFKQDALGGGDIKLYALVGIFLELELVFFSLFLAATLALLGGKLFLRNMNPIPFVPFIFLGSVLAYIFGPTLLEWYASLF